MLQVGDRKLKNRSRRRWVATIIVAGVLFAVAVALGTALVAVILDYIVG